MGEPRWRRALCWGAVIAFFMVPASVFVLEFLAFTIPGWSLTKDELAGFKWLGQFQITLAGLVFGLAGLNSWDKRNGAK